MKAYHVTDTDDAADILREGFAGGWGDVGFGVYFWNNLDYAMSYAQRGGWDEKVKKPVILEIDVPDSVLMCAVEDMHSDWEDERDKYEHTYWKEMDQDDEDARWKPSSIRLVQAAKKVKTAKKVKRTNAPRRG